MILGEKKFFTKEHFEQHKGFAPGSLCELVVYCFELLSQLSLYPFNFRFKGGNSLLLMLDDPQRFSIDVDIDTLEPKENLIRMMTEIQQKCEVFTKLEIRQHKTKPWLPMISFNLFYKSFYKKPEESFVMLDAVIKESPYKGYRKKIKVDTLYSSEQEVEISTPSGLMGDKLLTLGPSTLGIPLGKNKEAQRLKHVFDIARLSEKTIDEKELLESLNQCSVQENEIQKKNSTLQEVIQDTIQFCDAPLSYKKIPPLDTLEKNTYLYEIVKGYPEFKTYLFKMEYSWDLLKQDMGKVIEIVERLKETEMKFK